MYVNDGLWYIKVKTGKKPFQLIGSRSGLVHGVAVIEYLAKYESGYETWVEDWSIRPFTITLDLDMKYETNKEGEEEMTKETLYQLKDTDKFGHKIGVNRAGKWVMEIKGQDLPEIVDPDTVEEVIPYSVSVKFGGTSDQHSQSYDYWVEEGKVEEGDLIWVDTGNTWGMARVIELDTKSKKATKELKGTLLKGEIL